MSGVDKKTKKDILAHYTRLVKEHGDSVHSLGYKAVEQQEKRFTLAADIEAIEENSSILDVGSGLGHFCQFMRRYGWKGPYTGVDFNPDMITAARKKNPGERFVCKDILDFNEEHDYVFSNGTFEDDFEFAKRKKYVEKVIKKMFSLTRRALAFDVFSNRVDFKGTNAFYADPRWLLEFCYTLTERLKLRSDSRRYEIMMYLYKKTDKDRFHIYHHWSPIKPEIISWKAH